MQLASFCQSFYHHKSLNVSLLIWLARPFGRVFTSTHSSLDISLSSLSRSITSKARSVGANSVMLVKFIAEFSIICEKMLKFGSLFKMAWMSPDVGSRTLSMTWIIPLLAPWFGRMISPPWTTIVCQNGEKGLLRSRPRIHLRNRKRRVIFFHIPYFLDKTLGPDLTPASF